jgi:cell filamentation protein
MPGDGPSVWQRGLTAARRLGRTITRADQRQASADMKRWNDLMWEPGGHVLRNKFGARDSVQLQFAEYRASAVREGEIDRGEVFITRSFDEQHVKALHGHLFQDVYDWAGKFREVDIAKGKPFAPNQAIGAWVENTRQFIYSQDWKNMSREQFVQAAATVYAHYNVAHPFREGNGRTGKLLMKQLSELTPYRIDYDRVEKAVWNQASMESRPHNPWTTAPDPRPLVPVFDAITVERNPQPVATQEQAREVTVDLQKAGSLYQTNHPQTAGQPQVSAGERPAYRGPAVEPTHGRERGD